MIKALSKYFAPLLMAAIGLKVYFGDSSKIVMSSVPITPGDKSAEISLAFFIIGLIFFLAIKFKK